MKNVRPNLSNILHSQPNTMLSSTDFTSLSEVNIQMMHDTYNLCAWHLLGRVHVKAEPVSYTHLDVYKRQSRNNAYRAFSLLCSFSNLISASGKRMVSLYTSMTTELFMPLRNTVSYTHLDVYKRQAVKSFTIQKRRRWYRAVASLKISGIVRKRVCPAYSPSSDVYKRQG